MVQLLRLRPDLTLPAPPDIPTLARRVGVRSSVQRALDVLDAHLLGVLAGLVTAAAGDDSATAPARDEYDPASLAALSDRGLIWDDGIRLHLVGSVADLLTRSAAPGLSPESPDPPPMEAIEHSPAELDRLGATVVLEFGRLVDALAEAWTAHPPTQLRSGGVGVRELRRTARELAVDEPSAVLVIEVAFAAGLVNATLGPEPVYLPTPEYDDWRGQSSAARWMSLATAWLTMTRQPSLASQRDERGRLINVLGPDVERGTTPALRRQVLSAVATLPPGSAPTGREQVLTRLAWQAPRRAAAQRRLAETVLLEADQLGVTAAGGLTGYSRTLLAEHGALPTDGGRQQAAAAPAVSAAEHALETALPEPVDHVLVQPDLTVVVPGPPEPDLGAELALLAELESTGGAHVYRVTEASVRRALDAGRGGTELAEFLEQRSRTPLPQALRYLIDDAARRHGRLRVGTASSYLRCEDELLLARVVADRATQTLALRQLAPTVVISDLPVNRLLDGLRAAGYSPAAEAAGGELVTLDAEPARAPSRPAARSLVRHGLAGTDAQRSELVRRLRAGDALATSQQSLPLAGQVPGVTSAATMELLRRAIREDLLLWLGVAEQDGAATAHELRPISLAAGLVRGYEHGRAGLASYPVHRITAIRVLDDDE